MTTTGFDEHVVICAPRGAGLAIERAPIQARLTPGKLARRLLIDGLRANGFDLADTSSSRPTNCFELQD